MSDIEKLIHISNELSFLSGQVSMDGSVYEKTKQLIESLHREKILIKARNEYQQLEERNKELEDFLNKVIEITGDPRGMVDADVEYFYEAAEYLYETALQLSKRQ